MQTHDRFSEIGPSTPTVRHFWGRYVDELLSPASIAATIAASEPSSGPAFGKWFLVSEDGRCTGTGAWQIGYQYWPRPEYSGINGGQLAASAVERYLNDNTKIQFQYSSINRNVIAGDEWNSPWLECYGEWY